MSYCQRIFYSYLDAIQKGENLTLYEDTMADMLFNFMEIDAFYRLPAQCLSNIFAKVSELIQFDIAKFIILKIQKLQKKDISSILQKFERIMTPQRFSELLLMLNDCPQLTDEQVAALEEPKAIEFPKTEPPNYMELLERRNKGALKIIEDGYKQKFAEIRKIVRDNQGEIDEAQKRISVEREKAAEEVKKENEKLLQEQKELLLKIQDMHKTFEEMKEKLYRNEEQKKYYEEWMEQERAFENDKKNIENKLTTEVTNIREKIDLYKKQNKQGKKNQQQETKEANQQQDAEEEEIYEPVNKEDQEDEYIIDEGDEEIDTVRELIVPKNVVPIKTINKVKETPIPTKIRTIYDAIALQDIKAINDLITKRPNVVFEKGENRTTPIIAAVRTGNVKIVKLLAENGADPNVKDGAGNNAFHIAAATQNIQVVNYFVEIKADSNSKDKEGRTPVDILSQREKASNVLYEACKKGDLREMGEALRVWPDMANLRYKGLITPLHIAAGYNHTAFCEKLLTWGAEINAQDNKGNTPLHYTAIFGSLRTGQFLLDHGASAEIKNNEGKTALELQQ